MSKKIKTIGGGELVIVILMIIVLMICLLCVSEIRERVLLEKNEVPPFRTSVPQSPEKTDRGRFSSFSVLILEVAMDDLMFFLYGTLCGIMAIGLMVGLYQYIFIYLKNKGNSTYSFSYTAFQMDIAREKPLNLIDGMIYTDKFQDVNLRTSWDDEVIIGKYPDSEESSEELNFLIVED